MLGALSNSGFSPFGLTPLAGWIQTITTDRIEEFFPFEPGGQPFDYARVNPPDSLFDSTSTYRYDVGSTEGVFEIVAIAEPPGAALLGAAILCWAGLGWRGSSEGRVTRSGQT